MKYTFDQLKQKQGKELVAALEWVLPDAAFDLMNSEAVSSEICSTNATDWGLDTIEIRDGSIDVADEAISCTVDIQFAGEQDPDKGYCGDTISVVATATVTPDDKIEWDIDECERNE
jgi:hypothetical protein